MGVVVTRLVRYLYLDVVNYTVGRSVEAQTDIVDVLNDIVRGSVAELSLRSESIIYLPAGDGMGIAMLDETAPYDVQLTAAVEILRQLKAYNAATDDSSRAFEVRIGLSQNVDNIVTDINGSKNVTGHGINTAQRVMTIAGGSQIMASQMVYDTLSHREKYMHAFKEFTAQIKHGLLIPVYQFADAAYDGLNVSIPPQFMPKVSAEKRFSLYEAFYVAHAIANETFTNQHASGGQASYALTVLYHFMAEDSFQVKTRSRYDRPSIRTYGKEHATAEKAFEYYKSIDFWVCAAVSDHVEAKLNGLDRYFSQPFIAVNDKGKLKLKTEYPEICQEFAIV